ncbi:hypothetical protein [Streptomyces sp. NPDC127084]|uniref:hypothetical protein n=1 Tax=Streptomyces sp. NPDC127084 TaxID=3347133 RepID=UPI003654C35A
MAESLYDRYVKAAAADRAHGEACEGCSPDARCAVGQRLYESFARLQDAYLAQRKRS